MTTEATKAEIAKRRKESKWAGPFLAFDYQTPDPLTCMVRSANGYVMWEGSREFVAIIAAALNEYYGYEAGKDKVAAYE